MLRLPIEVAGHPHNNPGCSSQFRSELLEVRTPGLESRRWAETTAFSVAGTADAVAACNDSELVTEPEVVPVRSSHVRFVYAGPSVTFGPGTTIPGGVRP